MEWYWATLKTKVNDHRLSDKISNYLIVSEMKKIISNVTDGDNNLVNLEGII